MEGNDIVFTDESYFRLQYHDGRIRVWRHRATSLPTRSHIHARWSPTSQCEVSSTIVKTGIDRRTCELPIFSKTAWSPRSPDLMPCDFWLKGFLKDTVCRERLTTALDLKISIRRLKRHLVDIFQLLFLFRIPQAHRLKNVCCPNIFHFGLVERPPGLSE
ncbi:hypothetical protein TNCV_2047341 [Trichonephila clavipes]|uniref:Uncharacterized protein n=1 Tax=Trichonephila clavipes TaxID=2585209 RepID=A0A8X6SVA6_TRICX|nr:hypothetical protein TNCV_2047341 [Trichonephila clavipes]